MLKQFLRSSATAVALGACALAAQANTMTFENGVFSGVELPDRYEENGFMVSTVEFYLAPPIHSPAIVGLPEVSNRMFVGGHSATLTATDHSLFSVQQVELGSFFGVLPLQASVTFNGQRADGSVVTQTFAAGAFVPIEVTAPNPYMAPGRFYTTTMDVYTFSAEFTNLVSLTWDAVSSNSAGARAYYVDNLAVTPVPEPGTWALMAAGLLAMSWVGMRRRREESVAPLAALAR